MLPFESKDIMLLVVASLAVLGGLSFLAGFILLLRQGVGNAAQSIATQAANLAQKGIAEEVAGLVGNARSLVDALNQLVRTTAGIGIFLIIFGFLVLLVAFFLVKQMM